MDYITPRLSPAQARARFDEGQIDGEWIDDFGNEFRRLHVGDWCYMLVCDHIDGETVTHLQAGYLPDCDVVCFEDEDGEGWIEA